MSPRIHATRAVSRPRLLWAISLGVITWSASTLAPAPVRAEIVNLGATATATVTNYRPAFTGRGYYVDSVRGIDGNDGTEANPWKTLARASQATLSAGDALLLRCGRQFRETLELTSRFAPSGSILIGGYGDCSGTNRPEIVGSEQIPLASWQIYSSDPNGIIYKAQPAGEIAGVIRNGELQIKARHRNYATPATEFAESKQGTNSLQIVLSDVDRQSLGLRDIAGATIVIKSAPYHIEKNTVRSYDPVTGIVTLATSTQKQPVAGAGYYLEGKLWMLDADKEWVTDSSNNLYIYVSKSAPAGDLSTFEISRLKSTIKITGIRNLRIERLRINNSGFNGIHLVNSGQAQLEDLSISYSLCNAILLEDMNGLASSEGSAVKYSMLYGNRVSGISSSVKKTVISYNKITSTGALPGQTSNGAGIRLSGALSTAEKNEIYMSGQYGILLSNKAGGISIKNNTIRQVCLRLSDCGGIYSWGLNETGTPTSISYNQISSLNYVNTNGASGGAPDLVAGIYLDELSNKVDVYKNSISNVRHGIYLHKSSNNRISGNTIESASQAAIRVSTDWLDGSSAQGNIIEYNTLYVPNFFKPDAAGVPQKSGGVVQEWVHVKNSADFFSGPNRNISNGNVAIHLGDASSLRWKLQSGSVVTNIESVGWKTYSTTDFTSSPFRGRMAAVIGKQIIRDSTFEGSGLDWESYSYQPLAKIASFVQAPQCSGTCALFSPATSNDVLFQQRLMPENTTSPLMFFRYRAIAGSTDSSSKLEIRSDTPPYVPAGYLEDLISLPRNSERRQESFFKRTTIGNLRLSIKASAGSNILIDDVELFEVSNFYLLTPVSISRLLVNSSAQNVTISCVDLGLPSCEVVDPDGKTLSLPITTSTNSQRLIFLKNSAWSY